MTARPGRTLLELLVALGLLAILLGAVLGALARDARSHLALAARAEARAQLQAGAFALARDLRSLSPRAGDLPPTLAHDTAVQIRALQMTATVCDTAGTLAIRQDARADGAPPAPTRLPGAGDSAWMLVEDSTPRWQGARVIAALRAPAACASAPPGGGTPLLLGVDAPPDWRPAVGTHLRITRRARWSIYAGADGWQLGHREWNASLGRFDAVQPVVGPLQPPAGADPGLRIAYRDSLGATIAPGAPETGRVARVGVVLRARRLPGRAARIGELGAAGIDEERVTAALGRTEHRP